MVELLPMTRIQPGPQRLEFLSLQVPKTWRGCTRWFWQLHLFWLIVVEDMIFWSRAGSRLDNRLWSHGSTRLGTPERERSSAGIELRRKSNSLQRHRSVLRKVLDWGPSIWPNARTLFGWRRVGSMSRMELLLGRNRA